MIVYIPTRGRVERQPTYDTLVEAGVDVVLVCPKDEVIKHMGRGRTALGHDAIGICATRQWVMNFARREGYPKVFMFDDDLRFATRRLDDQGKFFTTPALGIAEMFSRLDAMLDQVPFVGLCERGGANREKNIPVTMNKRLYAVQCLDVKTFFDERFSYRLEFMSDFELALQFLTRGFPTALLTTHTKDNIGGADAPGGCSIDRTRASLKRSARIMADMYPRFVSLREVKAKSDHPWGSRTDVTIQWAKAFQHGCAVRDLLGVDQYPEPDWSGLAPEWEVL